MIKQTLLLILFSISFLARSQNNVFLVSLPDKDTIDHKYPVFNWYYTQQNQGRDDIRYNYVLVELKKNQSATSGVTVNQPKLRINGVQGFQLVYPYDAPELEYNKRYGWQLEKTFNGIIVEKSEAWEFILYKPIKEPYKYATLNVTPDATVYETSEGKLFFKLDERYKSTGTKFYIYDSKNTSTQATLYDDNNSQEDKKQVVQVVKTGANFFELDVRNLSTGSYKLIVVNTKGMNYQLNFLVK
ncbi:MAG: hypothetical protein M9916_07425 [Crocinitomicaceae bacterium]|nr:hypothetical protein [Crocinitomicaceae bacterium]